jgi:transcriptional regulator with XRE-family HTH domain
LLPGYAHARVSAASATLPPVNTSFGIQLRRLRRGSDMMQEELAERCIRLGRSMSGSQVRAYEQDLYLPALRTFVALARALEVPLDEVWGDGDL